MYTLPDGIGIAVELVNQKCRLGSEFRLYYTVTLKDQFGNFAWII
jgi:hypothetical protein